MKKQSFILSLFFFLSPLYAESAFYGGLGGGVAMLDGRHKADASDATGSSSIVDKKTNKSKLFPQLIIGYQNTLEKFFWGIEGYGAFSNVSVYDRFVSGPYSAFSKVHKNMSFGCVVRGGFRSKLASPYLLVGGELARTRYEYSYYNATLSSAFNKNNTAFMPLFVVGGGIQKNIKPLIMRFEYTYSAGSNKVSFKDYEDDTITQSFKLKENRFLLSFIYPFSG
ncbi:MAG: hypothetical protein ACPG7U_01425 [Holosporaceae bacterium]